MKTILFLDDENNLLSSLKRSFHNKQQWSMFFESSPNMAIKIISKNTIDLVVTDYQMAEMNGIDFLKKAKAINSRIKSIILSGQSEAEVFQKAKNIANDYLGKPIDFDILENKIIELLEE